MTKQIPDSTAHKENASVIKVDGQQSIALPHDKFAIESDILRDGQDLLLRTGTEELRLENYFSASPAPVLTAPAGSVLTPGLVDSFVQAAEPLQYAQHITLNDESPVGIILEASGASRIIHTDGTSEPAMLGTAIYQGDIIETDATGAVNIEFIDKSTFAVSQNARLAIDEYVFDPATDSGASDFSLLRGVFVFTSGLIGRDDPDDVHINTSVGHIGIRGTTIAGTINPGGESHVTVIEGAIVVTNDTGEITLSQQYETVTLGAMNEGARNIGVLDSESMNQSYNVLRAVAPDFFAGIAPEKHSDPASEQELSAPAQSSAVQELAEPDEPAQAETQMEAPSDPATEILPPPLLPPPETLMLNPDLEGDQIFAAPLSSEPLTQVESPILSPVIETAPSTSLPPPPPPSGTVLLPPLELRMLGGMIDEEASAGDIIAIVETTVAYPGVGFSLLGVPLDASSNPLFVMNRIAPNRIEIRLTVAGANEIDAGESFHYGVRASLPDGRTINRAFPVSITADVETGLVLNGIGGADGYLIATGAAGDRLGRYVASLGDSIFAITEDRDPGATYYINGAGQASPFAAIESGLSIAGAGDFNGDGIRDYILGSPLADDLDAAPGVSGNAMVIGLDGTALLEMQGLNTGQSAGKRVAGIGDINGDGFSDVLVSAPDTAAGQGVAYVLTGNDTPGNVDVTAFSGNGFIIEGNTGTGRFSSDIVGAGDFNRDGYADFMLSAPGENTVYVGFGRSAVAGGDFDTGTGNGFLRLTGIANGGSIPLFSAGDFNGDGVSDIVVTSTAAHGGRGMVNVVYGNAAYTDGATLNLATGVPAGSGFSLSLPALSSGRFAGGGTAGDFNGDGFDDMALVVRTGDIADIFVLFGRTGLNGSVLANNVLLENPASAFHMVYDLSLAGLANPATDPFGFSISTAGDVNGDGFDDLVIGTPDYNGNQGQALMVYGRNDAGTVNLTGLAAGAGDRMTGSAANDTMSTNGFGGVRMNAGGGDDTLIVNNTSIMNLDGGLGFDRVDLIGASAILDFTNTGASIPLRGSEALSGVEKFVMANTGQTIRLGLDDIFRLLQESDDGTLRFTEGAGGITTNLVINNNDSPGATGNFTSAAASYGFTAAGTDSTTDPGVTYNVYDFGSGYQLLIDTNINNVTVV